MWFVHEQVSITGEDGAERQQWIYRRTFYDEADLAYHVDNEAAYLYNPNPVLRISRVELSIADEQQRQVQTPGAGPIDEQPPSDPNYREWQFPQVDNPPTGTEPATEESPDAGEGTAQ
jgi:hypothetical protein